MEREREIVRSSDARMLGCRTHAEVCSYLDDLGSKRTSREDLVGGIVLAWAGDAIAADALLERAHQRALEEQRFALAALACEQRAHQAFLFGELRTAASAIESAVLLAAEHGSLETYLSCIAQRARIALEQHDLEAVRETIEHAAEQQNVGDLVAFFAPVAVAAALQREDLKELHRWSSQPMVETALGATNPDAAAAAAIACAAAAEEACVHPPLSWALRRALLLADHARMPELASLAARAAPLADAGAAACMLPAMLGGDRPYLRAHTELARAYLHARCGDRAQAIASAGTAARSFDRIGYARWSSEAMLTIVRQNGGVAGGAHRAKAPALTRREQEVADLLRRGASNREVARTLQISEHTVERHVSSILSRLGLRSRWQLADALRTERQY